MNRQFQDSFSSFFFKNAEHGEKLLYILNRLDRYYEKASWNSQVDQMVSSWILHLEVVLHLQSKISLDTKASSWIVCFLLVLEAPAGFSFTDKLWLPFLILNWPFKTVIVFMTVNTSSASKWQGKIELITQSRKNITWKITYKTEMIQLPSPLERNVQLKSYTTDRSHFACQDR